MPILNYQPLGASITIPPLKNQANEETYTSRVNIAGVINNGSVAEKENKLRNHRLFSTRNVAFAGAALAIVIAVLIVANKVLGTTQSPDLTPCRIGEDTQTLFKRGQNFHDLWRRDTRHEFKAFNCFKIAADQGLLQAQILTAGFYQTGVETRYARDANDAIKLVSAKVFPSHADAIPYLEMAIAQGSLEAQLDLAYCIER